MEWNDLDMDSVTRIDFSCVRCSAINVKIKGEDLECDRCGRELFQLGEASE